MRHLGAAEPLFSGFQTLFLSFCPLGSQSLRSGSISFWLWLEWCIFNAKTFWCVVKFILSHSTNPKPATPTICDCFCTRLESSSPEAPCLKMALQVLFSSLFFGVFVLGFTPQMILNSIGLSRANPSKDSPRNTMDHKHAHVFTLITSWQGLLRHQTCLYAMQTSPSMKVNQQELWSSTTHCPFDTQQNLGFVSYVHFGSRAGFEMRGRDYSVCWRPLWLLRSCSDLFLPSQRPMIYICICCLVFPRWITMKTTDNQQWPAMGNIQQAKQSTTKNGQFTIVDILPYRPMDSGAFLSRWRRPLLM